MTTTPYAPTAGRTYSRSATAPRLIKNKLKGRQSVSIRL